MSARRGRIQARSPNAPSAACKNIDFEVAFILRANII